MKYVYLLNTYEEHGPMEQCATLDRGKIREMMFSNWSPQDDMTSEHAGRYTAWRARAALALSDLLKKEDADLVGFVYDLSDGWGGMQFQVLPLHE